MVSIAAFQAVDPGSIPGWRICFFFPYNYAFFLINFKMETYQKCQYTSLWKQLPELYQKIEFYKTALLYVSSFFCLLCKLNQFDKNRAFFDTKYGNVGI